MFVGTDVDGELLAALERRCASGFKKSHIIRQALWAYFRTEGAINDGQA